MDPDWLDEAPLLRAWVEARRRLASGELRPFTIPGHKHRTDLVGDLIVGDIPMYGGLAPVREADTLLRAPRRGLRNGWAPTGAGTRSVAPPMATRLSCSAWAVRATR